jgi:hypothetical protein
MRSRETDWKGLHSINRSATDTPIRCTSMKKMAAIGRSAALGRRPVTPAARHNAAKCMIPLARQPIAWDDAGVVTNSSPKLSDF